MEYRLEQAPSLRLDVGRPDYLGPLVGFGGDEFAEIGGRSRQRRTTQIDKARFHLGIGEAGVDLLVELVDDLDGRVPGCADPVPGTRLVPRQEIAHGRN